MCVIKGGSLNASDYGLLVIAYNLESVLINARLLVQNYPSTYVRINLSRFFYAWIRCETRLKICGTQ